ncbi:MAG: domain containing protein, partial [Acidobacteria bacterium]|nr:domain containing protein [Acidobacteriota bacterium]
GNVSNTATVSATTGDPNSMNNSATAATNVGAQANLSITKSGPANANTGQNITYTVVVSNAGPSPALNTVVSDVTPVGIAFVSNTGACTSVYPCNLGTLAAGQSATITSTYTIPGNYSGATVVNTASVNSSVNDPDNMDNTSSATTNVAQQTDVAIVKSGPASASPGLPIVYTIVATNNGSSAAANVVVSDPPPPGLTFVSNTGACTSTFPCNLGTLNPGQSATITATFAVPPTYSSPTIVNTASVTTTAIDPNSSNDSSTVTTPINTQADISVTKSGPASFTAGQNLVYTVVVSNIGTQPATNTFVSDPTPAGINFVSNAGGCTSVYPCAVGTLTPGQSVTITSTYNVPVSYAGTTISNTATGSTSSPDPNASNNSGSVTTPRSTAGGADLSISKSGPGSATSGATINFTIVVDNHGPAIATGIVVFDPTPTGFQFVSSSGACTTAFPCSLGTLNPAQSATIIARYKVLAHAGSFVTNVANVTSAVDPDSSNNRSSRGAAILATPVCPQQAPRLISPAPGATITSPATFAWGSVPNAIGYRLTINGTGGSTVLQTTKTSLTLAVPSGAASWSVEALGSFGCQPISSELSGFNVCTSLSAPTPSVVGEATTGQTYTVEWTPVDGAVGYELQESLTSTFARPTTFTLNGTAKTFTKSIQNATPFFYRVRALSLCSQVTNPYSPTISVVVVPLPNPDGSGNGIVLPYGTATPVTFQVFVPGLPGITTSFVATVDKPWLAVSPTNGVIGPEGVTLSIFADPGTLAAGTWNGTVLVVYGTTGVIGKSALAAGASKAIPVSINLTTPVSPASLTAPAASALLIPSVGHLAGVSSSWRSDIRVANTSAAPVKYQVTFNLANGDAGTLLKQTVVNVDAGATLALDDIVRNWYGVGSLADSANGVLSIQALDGSGNPQPIPGGGSKTTVVSSRTYNAATTGTLGQFIPATPFANFIGRAGSAAVSSILSLQQIAQTDAYRTNLGLVEGSGKPASLSVNVFDAAGSKVLSLPLSLAAGEQKQLNGFLAQNGISIANGRVEVQVTGGDVRVKEYA